MPIHFIVPDTATSGALKPQIVGDWLRTYGSSSGYFGIKCPATGPSIDWTWPTADASGYLKSDGAGNLSFAAVTVPTAANPTASVGLTAVNGSAATFMRSDGAPALDQTITPTMTGSWIWAKTAGTGTQSPVWTLTAPAHTTLTASTEANVAILDASANCQWSTGALTQQRAFVMKGQTLSFVGASTVSAYSTLDINSAGTAGTNATITSNYYLTCGGASSPVFSVNASGKVSQTATITDSNTVLHSWNTVGGAQNATPIYIRSAGLVLGQSSTPQGGGSAGILILNGSGSNIWDIANFSGNDFSFYSYGSGAFSVGYGNGLTSFATTGTTGTFNFYKTVSTYNSVATAGLGLPAIYGLDNRTGLTAADGAATTLYTSTAANQLYRVTLQIFATAAVTGTAAYSVTWTENAVSQTLSVTATAINTPGTTTALIRPDNATAIKAQLTGTFTGTFTVAALVEELV
ncbi:MAG: hypothetical protein ACYCQK_01355 [Acidiferrobacteraceae bacterium]